MDLSLSRLRGTSIGSHLFVLALGAVLPVVLFATGLAFIQAREERETFERGMHDRVVAINSAIDAELRATVAALRTLAESQSLLEGDLARFHLLTRRLKEIQGDWVTVILTAPDGKQQVNAMRPADADPLGTEELVSFNAVLRTLLPAVGSLSTGPRNLQQAFAVRVPVLREGRLAHVLTAVVDPAAISRILREQGMPDDWVASVVDRQLLHIARQYQGQVQVGVSVAPAFRAALTSGATQGAYQGTTLESTPSYVTWRRSAFSGWSVGIGVPSSSVEASAQRVLILGLLGIAASLALALLLARVLARRISLPVALLAAQAHALRHGGSGTPSPSGGSDAPPSSPGSTPHLPPHVQHGGDPRRPVFDMRELSQLQQALADAARAMQALAEARQQAESANRAKDEFLAMLGHELRNPLSAITTAAQVLRIRPDGPAAANAQQVLQRQAVHLTRLVDDLLDASRVSLGKIELHRMPLDMTALVERVASQVVAGSPKHRLDMRLDATWVSGDDTRLEQIVTNLLSNAVRYSPDGGVIRLQLQRFAEEVRLTVSDEGLGMAPELLHRVFDLFVQGERGAARSQGGLGIGLTLAHRLAALHAGQLVAHSDGEGQGSTFTLTLPAIEPPAGSDSAIAQKVSGQVRALTVLLVDDNDDGRTMLREWLEAAGHRVTEALDGLQALDRAATGTFDVALIDIGLPGLDGLEVARRMRALGPPFAQMPLVAITGYGAPQDHARSRAAGFDLHLVKPVDGPALLLQLQHLHRRAHAADPSSRSA